MKTIDKRYTKLYLMHLKELRDARIKFNENSCKKNELALDLLKLKKWNKRKKYNRSYIKSGFIEISIKLKNDMENKIEVFYAKCLA